MEVEVQEDGGEAAGGADGGSEADAQLAEAQARSEELEAQLADMKDRMLRVTAEAENVRERSRRQLEEGKKFAIQKFAKELLDVADNLARAAEAVPEEQRKADGAESGSPAAMLAALYEGVTMVDGQLLGVLGKHGVEKIDPLGEEFDPNDHEALFEVPDPSKEAGTVAHVQKPGYKLHGRVVRPAQVGVYKA
eukprot:PRCOL_00000191-RA